MRVKLDELSPSPKPMPAQLYAGEAFLAIVAGSDTTATAICSAFAYILHDKKYFNKYATQIFKLCSNNVLTDRIRLREEIDNSFPWDEEKRPVDDTSTLSSLPILNGIMCASPLNFQMPDLDVFL